MWLDLGDNLLEDTKIEAQRDERTCSRSQRKFHLFPCVTCSWTLFQATLTSLLFGLFRVWSIHDAAVLPGGSICWPLCWDKPLLLLHQHLLELPEVNRQHRSPYSSTSYSGPLEIIDRISTYLPSLLL